MRVTRPGRGSTGINVGANPGVAMRAAAKLEVDADKLTARAKLT